MRGKRYLQGLMVGLLFLVIGVQQSFGSGFAIYEGSARGNSLGWAVAGRADDPSALFFNPAGITQLPGLQAMTGATFIIPTTHITMGGVDSKMCDHTWVPPHAYLTYQLTDKVWLGFGGFTQWGLGSEFDENWPGRYNSYRAFIESLTFNPNIAFKVNDKLSLAAGFDIVWIDVDIRQAIPTVVGTQILKVADQTLKGDAFGYGLNLAVHYKPVEWLALGASYRSQVHTHVRGEATFSNIMPGIPLSNTSGSSSLTLPDEVFLGAVFYPTKRLSVEVDLTWTNWSTWSDLTLKYDNPIVIAPTGTISVAKDWSDVWRIGLGVEYKALDWLDLRAGYTYDPSPVPDAHVDFLVPDNDRHVFSFGPGFHFGPLTVDLSYNYIHILDRNVAARPQDGIFQSATIEGGGAHLIGASVGYKF